MKTPAWSIAAEEARVGSVWESLWHEKDVRLQWSQPSPEVSWYLNRVAVPEGLAVDVGCGTGRHMEPLLAVAYSAVGLDYSMAALRHARSRCLNLRYAAFVRGSMFDLPFPDRRFSVVLAFNVVYHASLRGTQRALQELIRCCVPGGAVLVTLLSTRNKTYGLGREVEPGTFVRESEPGDRGVIHHFFTADEIVRSARGARITDMIEREPWVNGTPDPGGHHWFVLLRA
jgi:SAM-dependent methyltransferase